jgi:hypothetical protein
MRKTGNYWMRQNQNSDFMDLGRPFQDHDIFFFETANGCDADCCGDNKILSPFQLKLLEYIAGLLSPSLFQIYTASDGVMEGLRSYWRQLQ